MTYRDLKRQLLSLSEEQLDSEVKIAFEMCCDSTISQLDMYKTYPLQLCIANDPVCFCTNHNHCGVCEIEDYDHPEEGFDCNVLIHRGIPYMNLDVSNYLFCSTQIPFSYAIHPYHHRPADDASSGPG